MLNKSLKLCKRTLQSFYVFLSFLRKSSKVGVFGFVVLILYVLMATVGPHIVRYDPRTRWEERFQWPSIEHPLGTDFAGRDVLAQLVLGSTDCLTVAFLSAFFTILIGVLLGCTSAFMGGFVDIALMRFTDVIMTVPKFPIMMILAATVRLVDPISMGIVLAMFAWPGLSRAVRSQILSLKEREFIEAAKLLGLSNRHIIVRELTPNILPFVTVEFVRSMRGGLTAILGLMFLGLVPYSSTNWGVMLNQAFRESGAIYTPAAAFYIASPMLAIILFQYAALCFSRSLDEWFAPRLRAHE